MTAGERNSSRSEKITSENQKQNGSLRCPLKLITHTKTTLLIIICFLAHSSGWYRLYPSIHAIHAQINFCWNTQLSFAGKTGAVVPHIRCVAGKTYKGLVHIENKCLCVGVAAFQMIVLSRVQCR